MPCFYCNLQTGQVLGRVNLVTGHVKTQLIAHDKEVYDIAFSRAGGGRDMFASVGKTNHLSVMINQASMTITVKTGVFCFSAFLL